jgi:hypothetical protein
MTMLRDERQLLMRVVEIDGAWCLSLAPFELVE